MVDWYDMEEFRGVDLNDSWVLSWEETEDNLVFQIEASLWPGHPKYTEPPKSDWTCYRTLQRNDDGSFLLCGDFGEVTIESGELVFQVN